MPTSAHLEFLRAIDVKENPVLSKPEEVRWIDPRGSPYKCTLPLSSETHVKGSPRLPFPLPVPLSRKIRRPAYGDLETGELPLQSSAEGHVVRKIRFSQTPPDPLLQDAPSKGPRLDGRFARIRTINSALKIVRPRSTSEYYTFFSSVFVINRSATKNNCKPNLRSLTFAFLYAILPHPLWLYCSFALFLPIDNWRRTFHSRLRSAVY